MKFKNWNQKPPHGKAAELMKQGIPALTALVLDSRGCETAEAAWQELSCGTELLHDPMEMAGMKAAVERITRAINQKEQICVYGDYDVDGITSTCLLTSRLRELGGMILPYVPNRLSEGYSLNRETLEELKQKGISLIVTVDCGITNIEETLYAKSQGIDIVITDHHECKAELPAAAAVVNPHQLHCPYPFKCLAGVGVALKVALALTPPELRNAVLFSYSDLAAVGTVADVMELSGENRAIVSIGLQRLQKTSRPGLRMLLQEAGLEGKNLTSTSISYSLAPRLNAAGRMGCPELAVRLLLSKSDEEALIYARQLCELNRERQAVEQDTFQQCASLLEEHPSMREHCIILAGENWHQGVIGIVASRLVEQYHLPTFMICLENDRGKGSCRSSVEGFSLFDALECCSDLLDTFGGHEQAAGFTIPAENIPEFRRRMTELTAGVSQDTQSQHDLMIDALLTDVSLLSPPNVEGLQQLEPYGAGNPRPTFQMNGVQIVSCMSVGGGKHIRLQIEKNHHLWDAIFFSASMQECGIHIGQPFDIAFYPQMNEYRGIRTVQLLVIDLRRSPTPMQQDYLLYKRYKEGEELARQELLRLIPERQDFVSVWRYLARPNGPVTLQETPISLTQHICTAMGRSQPCATTMICLEVFHERGLIDLSGSSRQMLIEVHRGHAKVDLNASSVLQRLRRLLDDG